MARCACAEWVGEEMLGSGVLMGVEVALCEMVSIVVGDWGGLEGENLVAPEDGSLVKVLLHCIVAPATEPTESVGRKRYVIGIVVIVVLILFDSLVVDNVDAVVLDTVLVLRRLLVGGVEAIRGGDVDVDGRLKLESGWFAKRWTRQRVGRCAVLEAGRGAKEDGSGPLLSKAGEHGTKVEEAAVVGVLVVADDAEAAVWIDCLV